MQDCIFHVSVRKTKKVRLLHDLLEINYSLFDKIDLFQMQTQPLFHTDKLEKSLSLAFEIASNTMICSLKPLSVQQFVKNFHLREQNSE